jgi:antitoxin component YwqK of YwqJK toxin-antitoxin module
MNWHAVKDQQNASYYRIINYIDGKPSGLVHTYTMLGKLRFEGYLRQEDPAVFGDGKATFYDDFGVKTSEGTYSGGMKNGLWAEWY